MFLFVRSFLVVLLVSIDSLLGYLENPYFDNNFSLYVTYSIYYLLRVDFSLIT